jgi:hypothetical protein
MFRPMGLGFHEAALAMPLPGFGEAARVAVASSEAPPDNAQPMSIAQAFGVVLLRVMESADPGEDRAELAALIGEIDAMRASIEQRVEARKSARVANLSGQHAEVYSQCRAALDRLRGLQQERGRINAHLNALTVRLGDARAAFGTVQNSKPSLASFPSDDELANWYRATAVARQQFDAVETQFREAKLAAHTAESEFEAAARELDALTAQEASLRAQLSGQPQASAMPPRSEFPFLTGKGE